MRERLVSFLYCLLGLSLVLSISSSLICGALLIILWALPFLKARSYHRPHLHALDIVVFLYASWMVVNASIQKTLPLGKAFSSESAVLLFFLLSFGTRWVDAKKFVIFLCVGGTLSACLGIMQSLLGINYRPELYFLEIPKAFQDWPGALLDFFSLRNARPVGTRSHPLTYSETLIPVFFIFPLFLSSLLQKKRADKKKWIYALGWGLISVAIMLSGSRGVWMGVGIGSLFLLPLVKKKYRLLTALTVLALGLFILIFSPHLRQRFLSTFSSRYGTFSDRDSRSVRFQLWAEALDNIKKKPVLGKGGGGVQLHVPDPLTKMPRVWSEAHNLYLQSLLEGGLIGFGLLCAILFLLAVTIKSVPFPWMWGCYGILAAFLTAGLTESWVNDKEIALLFWAFAGAVELLRKQYSKETL